MAYYFLREDLDILNQMIRRVHELVKDSGRQIGESCTEGAETYHDNFSYEEAVRTFSLNTARFMELIRIQGQIMLVEPDQNHKIVSIGSTVKILDMDTDELETFQIGSYLVFREGAISYTSPLARLLLGASLGYIRKGIIGSREREFLILEI